MQTNLKSKIKSCVPELDLTGGELSESQQHCQSSSGSFSTENLQRLKDVSTSSPLCRVPRPLRGGADLHRLEQEADQPRGADSPNAREDFLDETDFERQLGGRARLCSTVRKAATCTLEAREAVEGAVLRSLEEQCLCLLHQVADTFYGMIIYPFVATLLVKYHNIIQH